MSFISIDAEQRNFAFLKTYNIRFDNIALIFTEQNDKPLEIEDKVNLKFLIN